MTGRQLHSHLSMTEYPSYWRLVPGHFMRIPILGADKQVGLIILQQGRRGRCPLMNEILSLKCGEVGHVSNAIIIKGGSKPDPIEEEKYCEARCLGQLKVRAEDE